MKVNEMARRVVPLTDMDVKKAKKKEKKYKLYDGGGLYLLVMPTGSKLWRLKYRLDGKEKQLAYGKYPDISLSEARQRREESRQLVAKGIDPAKRKNVIKAEQQTQDENIITFKKVALEWHEKKKKEWSEKHAKRVLGHLELDVFGCMGTRPISEIETPEIVDLLERVARRTLETAKRLKIAFYGIWRHATLKGYIKFNPATDLRDVLPASQVRHMAAPTEPEDFMPILKAIDSYSGSLVVQSALCLAPLLFVRPGELRSAEWSEINFETETWNIPAERMKMKKAHIVPLCSQSIAVLKKLQGITGHSKYVFPGKRSHLRCMSENTVNKALRSLGLDKDQITGHGFRATARTILDEVLEVRPDYIEHQLAHKVLDPNGRAYNRTKYLAGRKIMMQKWADYIDQLKSS